jgi:L-histidine Nalpha-methyltransferase
MNAMSRQQPKASDFLKDALAGLAGAQKTLPAKYFYDAAGSALFEAITALPEYYPTRTELALLHDIGPRLRTAIGPDSLVVEFGAGSGEKAELLLRALDRPAGYVAIEISASALDGALQRLRAAFPGLPVCAIEGDFSVMTSLPLGLAAGQRLGFFPGSTIGNLNPVEAEIFLCGRRAMLGPGGRFLIGVDLAKDPAILLPAYDDAQGVTAAFNLNMLKRLNRELDARLDVARFRHEARWNAAESRIEMHLVARDAQTAYIAGQAFSFRAGESIHTENSYKYTPQAFAALAARAGWRTKASFFDAQNWFGLFLLELASA